MCVLNICSCLSSIRDQLMFYVFNPLMYVSEAKHLTLKASERDVAHGRAFARIVGSIPHGAPIELFLVSMTGVTKAILSVRWCI